MFGTACYLSFTLLKIIVVDYSQLGPEQALSQLYMYKIYNIGGQQKNKTNIETKKKTMTRRHVDFYSISFKAYLLIITVDRLKDNSVKTKREIYTWFHVL